MVTEKDLLEDYNEVIKSGDLNFPKDSKKKNLVLTIILWIVIFTLIFWSVSIAY
tara:strand:- start:549 stop:710 length:162 start_codon:yes stop_codon:yes gene_type:complete